MVNPTIAANANATDEKTRVAQRLPDSRATVENSAAPKARINPTRASRNRTQTSEISNGIKRAQDRMPAV